MASDPGYEFITMDSTQTCQSNQMWSTENIECGLGMYIGKLKNAFLSILVYIVLLRCLVQYNSSKTLYFHSVQTCYTTEFHTFCKIRGKTGVTITNDFVSFSILCLTQLCPLLLMVVVMMASVEAPLLESS